MRRNTTISASSKRIITNNGHDFSCMSRWKRQVVEKIWEHFSQFPVNRVKIKFSNFSIPHICYEIKMSILYFYTYFQHFFFIFVAFGRLYNKQKERVIDKYIYMLSKKKEFSIIFSCWYEWFFWQCLFCVSIFTVDLFYIQSSVNFFYIVSFFI